MKRLNICYLFIVVILGTLTACQQDDNENSAGNKGSANVTLRITTAEEANTTRAWNDDNAETDRSEMMYNWTVLLLNNGQIQYKFAGTPTDANAEIDNVCTDYEMTSGAYTVYSFANISEASLKTVLGISSLEPGTALTDNAIETATATINANGKTRTDLTADDAFGFGSKGIPMSNQQVLEVPAEGTIEKDLIVVRMVAKLEFVFFNATKSNGGGEGEDLTVKSVSISDITKASAGNQKLLPNLNNIGPNAEDMMTFIHGDIKPNLGTDITTEVVKYTYPAATPLTVASTDEYDISKLPGNANHTTYTKKLVFYVNETQLATGKQFELNVELNNGDYRYALVSTGNNSGLTVGKTGGGNNEDPTKTPVTEDKRSDDWTYIARNDYRIIPIVLDNYRLELVPYDFPAIGVYPASVKTLDANTNLHEILFHDYGHFHLVPHVYRGKAWIGTEGTEGTEAFPWTGKDIAFSAKQGNFSSTVWTLDKAGAAAAAADWTNAFTSFTTTGTYPNLTKGNELTTDLNSGTVKFYGAPGATGLPANNVYPTTLPVYGTNFDAEVTHTTADGKTTYSQGDFPMLDAVTHWKPKTDDSYLPYIYGQIAPQDDNADKTVYHEFRVNVYVAGETVARQLVYRFYMHLKQDFGLARRYAAARPTCRLHCHE